MSTEAPGVAFVTGGGRGIGRAIALALAGAGFDVALVSRSGDELEDVRREIVARGARALALRCDVRDASAVAGAVEAAATQLGPITTLVNNAATQLALGPLWAVDPDAWWTDVEVSLGGAFNACRAAIPGMIERGGGRIVNVSSYAALGPAPFQTGYACGKAALLSLTESLAASLAPHGVKAFAFSPGFVDTELTRRMLASPEAREWFPGLVDQPPLPSEVGAKLVVDIALGRADALSGRFLHALDDLDELLRRVDEVEREEYYVARLRRLPT